MVSESVKSAGDKFNEAIVRYVRKRYNILIGERTAEDIKIKIGCLSPRSEKLTMTVKGRCIASGLPREFTITSDDTMDALEDTADQIIEAVHDVLSRTPPELVGDISTDGIVITGGGGLIFGFDRLIASRVGIPVYVAEDAISCVAKGTGAALDYIDDLAGTKVNSPKKKYRI